MRRNHNLDNIRRIWCQADDVDRTEGMTAFPRYRATLERLANVYGVPLASAVGVFCALSPNNAYMTNLRAVKSMLSGGRGNGYTACRLRAKRCIAGENFLSFTKGLKTRNFYQNIMDPGNHYPVTIDGHAYCIWVGKRMTMKQAVRAKFDYHKIADGYREVAGELGIVPCQLQAVTWFAWKRINKIVYNGQMNMFWLGDQWRLDLEPHEIEDFVDKNKS